MRMIYLTLGFFILLGIAATCRTPPLVAGDCEDNDAGMACREALEHAAR